ncbi:TniQ family protein [Sulfurimonas sp.]|uniref:TniQ family protein n=1 Tax=Sulfurimonas sp. TaxID=2022749 RepID=UPI0019F2A8F5|nr:TniQ family protein [Sulfurimonas sp.]MBE0513914.1 TniQ family protein [Sulfurimonas sp.]
MISYVTAFIDLSQKPFVLHPHPHEDELLSSWLVRVSVAHDTMPCSLMNMHFPEYKNIIFSRDLDVWANDDLLAKLSIKSNLPAETLFSMTLQSYRGILQKKILTNTGNNMLSPIVSRARKNQKHGLKYCPLCLAEDSAPYFRKIWRVSFYSVCLTHRILLLDKCCKCKKPISFYKFKDDAGFTKCWFCGQKLSLCTSIPVADNEYLAIKKLSDIILDKKYKYANQEISVLDFFTVYHQIAKILNPHSSPSNRLNPCESLKLSIRFWEEFDNLLNGKNISATTQKSVLSKDMTYIPAFYKKKLDTL